MLFTKRFTIWLYAVVSNSTRLPDEIGYRVYLFFAIIRSSAFSIEVSIVFNRVERGTKLFAPRFTLPRSIRANLKIGHERCTSKVMFTRNSRAPYRYGYETEFIFHVSSIIIRCTHSVRGRERNTRRLSTTWPHERLNFQMRLVSRFTVSKIIDYLILLFDNRNLIDHKCPLFARLKLAMQRASNATHKLCK